MRLYSPVFSLCAIRRRMWQEGAKNASNFEFVVRYPHPRRRWWISSIEFVFATLDKMHFSGFPLGFAGRLSLKIAPPCANLARQQRISACYLRHDQRLDTIKCGWGTLPAFRKANPLSDGIMHCCSFPQRAPGSCKPSSRAAAVDVLSGVVQTLR